MGRVPGAAMMKPTAATEGDGREEGVAAMVASASEPTALGT